MKKLPVEFSEDRRRGEMPHIRRAVEALERVSQTTCADCRTRSATHLVNVRSTPLALCAHCADGWRSMSPLMRRQAGAEWSRRGGRQ